LAGVGLGRGLAAGLPIHALVPVVASGITTEVDAENDLHVVEDVLDLALALLEQELRLAP
jgi:hypothetical protein